MKTVILPESYNYVEVYLTFRCNLNCDYCINNMSGEIVRDRKELSAEEWINGLNRINFGAVPLTIGGGEPTLHREFYSIVENLRSDIQLDLLTNLTFDTDEFIKKNNPEKFNKCKHPAYKSIRVSYHTEKMNSESLIDKMVTLQDSGYSIGLFGLNHPNNIEKNMYMTELARINKIFFFVKDFLGSFGNDFLGYYKYPEGLNRIPKKAECRTQELLIGPEGNIFRCHRDLYHCENPVGHINDPDLAISDIFRPCSNYGYCNPCDVKLKTNRFLQMGHCSVEIRDKNGSL